MKQGRHKEINVESLDRPQ